MPATTSAAPIWNLGIEEIDGVIIESKVREEINEKLKSGWVLLHVYTLKYKEEDGIWRERPMAIIGKPGKGK